MRETLAPEAPSADPEALAAGARIDGRYCLERPLGAGSEADVWRARDVHLERHVALKILRGDGISDGARFRMIARTLERAVGTNDHGRVQERDGAAARAALTPAGAAAPPGSAPPPSGTPT